MSLSALLSVLAFTIAVFYAQRIDSLSADIDIVRGRLANAEAEREQRQRAMAENMAAALLLERHADLADENMQLVAKWWCNTMVCVRSKSDCLVVTAAFEENGEKPGTCEPRRRAYCFLKSPEAAPKIREVCTPDFTLCANTASSPYLCHGYE